ncbi:IGDCC4 [Mytilus coruscus]|uniref:IGDCC4 n=1 Tax=Mytilus coruscus TaxID=42192 RepID=A0A6J8CA56_MYTCO|nr:IGDCC4 [Mytilus coruscus]
MDNGKDDQVPYSEGLDLNPKLDEAKFMVVGSYNTRVCNLQIKNFSKEEDGKYCCHHLVFATVYINVYNVAVKRPPSNLSITNEIFNNAIHAQAGRRLTLVCIVQSGVPPEILQWSHKGDILETGGPGMIKHTVLPSRKNNQHSLICSATNNLLLSPLTREIYLNVTYPPKVTVKYTLGPNYIEFTCNAAGEPNYYSFLQWIHESEFQQQIRMFNGTRSGILRVYRTKNPLKPYEDSGYYMCRVSNGIPNINGKTTQEGKTLVSFEGPPVYLLENMNVQYGTFGQETTVSIQIYSNTKLLLKKIRRNHAENDLESSIQEETVKGHIMFHGVKVMVSGTKLEFKIHMETAEDFNNYTIIISLTVTLENFSALQPIIVTVIIFVAVLGSVVACLVFRKKVGTCAPRQDLSDIDFSHEETQDTSVENQLYQLAEPVEFINELGRGRAMFRPIEDLPDLQMINHERNLVPDIELPNSLDISLENRRDLAEEPHVQINEPNLNYAEVIFHTKPTTNEIVVHGKEDRTIYSEIDHLKRADALPSSSESDSDDDFVYIEGIQNFLRKINV